MKAMFIGTALALIALAFVLYPLFQEPLAISKGRPGRAVRDGTNSAVDALREIEFDHVTGKLSDTDYTELKSLYTQRAVTAMRDDEADAVVCTTCGPRPESNALFCSDCGRALAA
jgi:hypothetical protein